MFRHIHTHSATNGKEKTKNSQSVFTYFSGKERDLTEVGHIGDLETLVILSFLSLVVENSVFVSLHTSMRTHTVHDSFAYMTIL